VLLEAGAAFAAVACPAFPMEPLGGRTASFENERALEGEVTLQR
jgi:hypothetical protein